MKLIDAISNLNSLDEEETIYAPKPWRLDSDVMLMRGRDDGKLPKEAADIGYSYFLEVFIARDFVQDWVEDLDKEPTATEKALRVIEYAVYDR